MRVKRPSLSDALEGQMPTANGAEGAQGMWRNSPHPRRNVTETGRRQSLRRRVRRRPGDMRVGNTTPRGRRIGHRPLGRGPRRRPRVSCARPRRRVRPAPRERRWKQGGRHDRSRPATWKSVAVVDHWWRQRDGCSGSCNDCADRESHTQEAGSRLWMENRIGGPVNDPTDDTVARWRKRLFST